MGTIHLLFGTESGNAELVADDVAAELERRGYVAKVHSMDEVDVSWLADAGGAIIITSTYGDGELPMTAVALHRALLRDRPDLSGLQFAAFGLGDSTYDTYNNGIEQLTEVLAQLGATPVGEIGRHDAASIDDHCDLGVAWVRELDGQGLVTRLAGDVDFAINARPSDVSHHLETSWEQDMTGTTVETQGVDDDLLPWHDPEFCYAPWPWYDRMLRERPVAVMSDGLVVVTKYADVMEHLKDRSLVAVPLEGMGDSPWAANLNSVLLTEGERHTRIRRAFGSWFTPKMSAQWGQVAAQSASDALDAMGPDAVIEGHRALGVQPAQDAMAHILGVPREDGFPYIHATNLTMETMFGTDPEDVRRANEAFGFMMFQADALIAAKRADRGDGMLLDKLIRSVEDGDLSERELKESVQILWGSAAHNPGQAMAGALADLAANPWVFRDYKDKPDRRDDIVSELLRRALPEVAIDRFATEPRTIRGVDVPVGTAVRFMLGAALRDPDVFPDPDVFDYDRPPSASAALAFGLGTHHCAGQALARAELRAVLDVLADRYDRIEVVGEPVWLFTPRHRNCEGLVIRLS